MTASLIERDGDLINSWYIICLSSELDSAKNGILVRRLYGRDYVLYRDAQGRATVMLDRCIHRGVQLSKGTCEKGHLRCPYHGWKFGENGEVTEIPSEGDGKSQAVQNKKGEVLPSSEKNGAIWVWPGNPALATNGPSWDFPFYQEDGWTQYFMITDFNNEVNHLVSNFMDVPHTVYVHSKWFRNRRLIQVPITVEVDSGRVKVTYHQKNDSIGFMGQILNPQGRPMIHTDEFIFPNITRVDYNFGSQHFIINSQCTPIDANRTRVYTWICYRLPFVGGLLKPFMQFYTRRVITQDVQIMENHGENLRKYPEFFQNANYKNSSADELHIAIEKMRSMGSQDRSSVIQMNYKRERHFWI